MSETKDHMANSTKARNTKIGAIGGKIGTRKKYSDHGEANREGEEMDRQTREAKRQQGRRQNTHALIAEGTRPDRPNRVESCTNNPEGMNKLEVAIKADKGSAKGRVKGLLGTKREKDQLK